MFSILKSVTKAALGVAATPLAIAADVITLGGSLQDRDEPYTASAIKEVARNVGDAISSDRE